MSNSVTPWIAVGQASLSITNSWCLLNLCPSSRWCHPTISSFVVPYSFNLPQQQDLFQWRNSLHQVTKVLEFQFNFSPSNENQGLLFFGIDWFDLLAVQGTQESSSTPQFKSISLQRSAFFIVQLSHPYMTHGKTIALTRRTFVGKVISLLFNMLPRFVFDTQLL